MTSPTSAQLSGPDSEPDDELSRVTVLVGAAMVDVAVPNQLSVSAVVDDVMDLADEQLASHINAKLECENTERRWTFARLIGDVIDPDETLAHAGVYDGETLVVQAVGSPASTVLIDDVVEMPLAGNPWVRWLAEHGETAGWFSLAIAVAATTVLVLPRALTPTLAGVPIAAVATLVVGIGTAALAWAIPYRSGDPGKSAWLAGVAMPLIFSGSLYVMPNANGAKALPMALALVALVALLQLLISGLGRSLFTAVITLALAGAPAMLVALFAGPNPRVVGAILATVTVIVIYLAPRIAILLSRLPVPRVPTAGEPLDDVETQGATTVEGVNAVRKQVVPTEQNLSERVRRAGEYLTGIVAAVAALALVGCYFAVDVSEGFFWQGAVFALAVATVLCLRGRSHHDLVQSAALIGAGLLIALEMIIKAATFVQDRQMNSAVALLFLMIMIMLCGLVAPRLDFSPVMRRRVEIAEYLAIGLIFPLACWIIRLYASLRELRI